MVLFSLGRFLEAIPSVIWDSFVNANCDVNWEANCDSNWDANSCVNWDANYHPK